MRKCQLAYSHGACTALHDSFCTVYPVRVQRCAAQCFFAISGATQTVLPGGRQNLDTGEQLPLMNATKYLSAIPVIALSATKYHVPIDAWLVRLVMMFIVRTIPRAANNFSLTESLPCGQRFYKPLWIGASVVNTLFSTYWDTTYDWDLPDVLRCCTLMRRPDFPRTLLRQDLLYGVR